jgi:hypothetical protein
MKMGTKSILFGIHQFAIHPIMLFFAWWTLYGFPFDPRLWVAFVVHDWGYWGKAEMDSPDGETHPVLGAKIMQWLFGPAWGNFTLLHSRFYSKRLGVDFSQLCVCDKLASLITPIPIYVLLARLTGEMEYYKSGTNADREEGDYTLLLQHCTTDSEWLFVLRAYMYRWIVLNKHKGLRPAQCRRLTQSNLA